MTKKLKNVKLVPLIVGFFFLVFGCRQDFLKDRQEQFNPNSSKFQVVKLSEIPNVTKFIKLKTGRNDLSIPLKSNFKNSAMAKGNIDFANLESSFIIKKTEADCAYYIFDITNAGDENTIYTFEAKEVESGIVSAKVLEYASNVPYGDRALDILTKFTGKITAYSLDGSPITTIDLTDGESPCPPDPYYPPPTNYPPSTGGGGGEIVTPNPPNTNYPTYPNYPSWPSYGGGSSGGSSGSGGSSSGGSSSNDCEDDWTFSHHVTIDGVLTWIYVNCKGDTKAVAALEANENKGTSKLTAPCDDGSGVVILPEIPKTPCEKIKTQREDEDFKEKVVDLEGKTGLKKETGYIQKWGGDYEYKDNAGATPDANTLSLPQVITNTYIKGFMHTHVKNYEFVDPSDGETKIKIGIKNFSPADVSYFMDLVQNAQTKGHPLDDVYGIMISNGVNYQIRFTGNQYQIKTFTDEQKKAHQEPYKKLMEPHVDNQHNLEKGFLWYIGEKMNLKGVTLYRMNADGTNTEIKLNNAKTDTVETNCPK